MAVRGNAAPAEYDVAKDATQQGTQAEAQADTAVNPAATPQDGGDPYKNPTGFVGFDQYFNANAGAAKKSADDVNSQVSAQANQANAGLAQAYAGFQQNVGKEVGKASVSGQWNDATFNPGSALEQQYKAAEGARDALGSAGGIQALTKGTGLGAALTQRAGAGQFQHTQDRYSELEKAFGDAQSDAANDNAFGKGLASDNYELINGARPPATEGHSNTQGAQGQKVRKIDSTGTGVLNTLGSGAEGAANGFGAGGFWGGVAGGAAGLAKGVNDNKESLNQTRTGEMGVNVLNPLSNTGDLGTAGGWADAGLNMIAPWRHWLDD